MLAGLPGSLRHAHAAGVRQEPDELHAAGRWSPVSKRIEVFSTSSVFLLSSPPHYIAEHPFIPKHILPEHIFFFQIAQIGVISRISEPLSPLHPMLSPLVGA
jgi:hypothetical protein